MLLSTFPDASGGGREGEGGGKDPRRHLLMLEEQGKGFRGYLSGGGEEEIPTKYT